MGCPVRRENSPGVGCDNQRLFVIVCQLLNGVLEGIQSICIQNQWNIDF